MVSGTHRILWDRVTEDNTSRYTLDLCSSFGHILQYFIRGDLALRPSNNICKRFFILIPETVSVHYHHVAL